MQATTNRSNLSIYNYLKIVAQTIFKPDEIFKDLNNTISELIGYLILSALFYAVLASFFRNLAPFLLLILSPISIIPHVFLVSLLQYLIFTRLFNSKTTLNNCFKISSYIFISLLPFMGLVFIKISGNNMLLLIKLLPYIYYIVLAYKASLVRFSNLKAVDLIKGNVLYIMIVFLLSTLVFTTNMYLLIIINKYIFGIDYQWRIHYI